jgi:Leucine Rich repeat
MIRLKQNWTRRAAFTAVFVVALGAALLVAHYARWDVVAKYPIDGVLTSCRSEGLIWETVHCELTADGTGQVVCFTLPAGSQEVGEFARATTQGGRVRVYYERRVLWLPWEGSPRQAAALDWLPTESDPVPVTAIEKLGGTITRDEKAKGKPIVGVTFNGTPVTDAVVKELKELKELRTLDLNMTRVTDAGLKELVELTGLQKLCLGHTPVTDAGLKELKALKGLRTLYLYSTAVTDAGLKELKDLKGLQDLDLTATPVTDAGLKELKELKCLQRLGLGYTQVTDAGLKELEACKELQALQVIETTKVTSEDVADIKKALPNLEVQH